MKRLEEFDKVGAHSLSFEGYDAKHLRLEMHGEHVWYIATMWGFTVLSDDEATALEYAFNQQTPKELS